MEFEEKENRMKNEFDSKLNEIKMKYDAEMHANRVEMMNKLKREYGERSYSLVNNFLFLFPLISFPPNFRLTI